MTIRGIAARHGLGAIGVKSHVRAILDKLGVQSRTQAALQALRPQVQLV
jgi:DNA-binding NarL/FixJ family response regulator